LVLIHQDQDKLKILDICGKRKGHPGVEAICGLIV
jgi:hypothetical protein